MSGTSNPAYRSIAQLSADAAAGLHFSPAYGLKVWLKSAAALQDRAIELEYEGDFEQAFVLTARAATLMVEKIPAHPEAPKHLTVEQRSNLKAHGQQCLKDLARLRSRLLQLEHIRGTAPPSVVSSSTSDQHAASHGHSSSWPRPHGNLCRKAPVPRQRVSSGASASSNHDRPPQDLETAFHGMNFAHRAPPSSQSYGTHGPPRSPSPPPTNLIIAYPSVPDQSAYAASSDRVASHIPKADRDSRPLSVGNYGHVPPPAIPRRPNFPAMRPEEITGGGYYARSEGSSTSAPSRGTPPTMPARKDPIPSSDNKLSSKSPAFTGSLRRLRLPTSILPTFLNLASRNTARGIETCALLLGTIELRFGAVEELVVEMLLVPKQKGTSDTCVMEEEEGVVGVQLERGLTALGWIHTHPTQTCFMSSMDLHTHAAYQQTLPEAVAIVCAPRSNPSYGIFRLTEPGGLETILQCRNARSFHEHADVRGGIYTDADHGHVKLRDGPLEVIDLRR